MDKKIISNINQKNGEEKTTTAINMVDKVSNLRKKNG